MDTREELNKTVSEMNHIIKDIIKVANMILLDMEDRIRRSELEMLDRIKYLLERERNH